MTMKTLPKTLALGAAVGCLLLGGVAQAQDPEPVVSQGEVGSRDGALVCFFECKEGYQSDWWQEVTTLVFANPTIPFNENTNDYLTLVLRLGFYDGQMNPIGRSVVEVGPTDVDEINVCRTLGDNAPSMGMITITNEAAGTSEETPYLPYVFIKNLTGKFFKNVDEPFDGRVTSVAKTECRTVPDTLDSNDVRLNDAPFVDRRFIENTGLNGSPLADDTARDFPETLP
jgi:hypothetical protein